MESRLQATVSGRCVELQARIIESFIGHIGDLMDYRNLCQPQHRCRVRNTFVYCSDLHGQSNNMPISLSISLSDRSFNFQLIECN